MNPHPVSTIGGSSGTVVVGRRFGSARAIVGGGSRLFFAGPTSVVSSILAMITSDWELQEASGTRVDAVAGNNLTANGTGGVGSTTGPGGGYPVAANFVLANNNYLSRPDFVAVQMGGVDFSMNAWVNPIDYTATRIILSKWGGTANEYEMYLTSAGKFGFSGTNVNTSTATVATGTWTMVSIVMDKTAGTGSLYINGAFDSSHVNGANSSNGVFQIGAAVGTGPFNGAVTGVLIAKGAKFTAAQITALYNGGVPRARPFNGVP